MVERVGELDTPSKILLLMIDQQAQIFHLRRRVLSLVMATVLEWNEQLHEVFDVDALLALTAHHPDLNDVATLVQAEQAADSHVAITSRRNDLQGEFQGVWLLKRRRLLALTLTRHPLSFEIVVDLILRNPWLFLAYLKTYEAWDRG
jgi:hypothetical protein